ncbi:MAG TPA: SLBB domain-containing protein, partial [Steroidobacteraceae bacterium]|nr:SLBB domain-containing protein [Steroidobacteraceae bacterium]
FSLPVETLRAGDSIYVPAADHFYVHGEVSKPGQYAIEPDMTLLQAIVKAGGITPRGSSSRISIKRHLKDKKYKTFSAEMSEAIEPDDVIEVKESIF